MGSDLLLQERELILNGWVVQEGKTNDRQNEVSRRRENRVFIARF